MDGLSPAISVGAIPTQGTGDDGNVLGKYDQNNANASLSHTTSLSYDPTHRLTGAVASGSSTYNLAFAYDQFGDMTCQQNAQTQELCPQYSFSSSTNRITSSGYTYDASGDLTNDGTHSYQYDAEGRLVSVDNGLIVGQGRIMFITRWERESRSA